MTAPPRLLLHAARPETRSALGRAAESAGYRVELLSGDPGELAATYGAAAVVRAPGGLVAAAVARGAPIPLCGPTAEWFIGLPESVTGRRWTVESPGTARSALHTGPAFVKLADAKHREFPARWFTSSEEFGSAVAAAGLGPDAELLLTRRWLRLHSEYRTFTRGRSVRAASPYQIEGELWSPLLHSHRASFHTEASRFVEDVLATLPGPDVPPATVLDAARLDDGRFVLLEGNQCWAAAIYGCDPDAVFDSVVAANTPTAGARWRWVPR